MFKQVFQLAYQKTIQFLKNHKLAIAGVSIVVFFWLFFFTWVNYHEVAIERNFFTGQLNIDSVNGPRITAPWVQVAMIETRPQRVCIDCSCGALNCRLIQFNRTGWKEFVEREGFRYYQLDNWFSFNSGAKHEYRGMNFILRGYAFDDQPHGFITIMKE